MFGFKLVYYGQSTSNKYVISWSMINERADSSF